MAAGSPYLVAYPNGAVAPFDPNNAKATAEHLDALADADKLVNPYTIHATGYAAVPTLFYSRRY